MRQNHMVICVFPADHLQKSGIIGHKIYDKINVGDVTIIWEIE